MATEGEESVDTNNDTTSAPVPLPAQTSVSALVQEPEIDSPFAWATIDGVRLPCVFRDNSPYLSVRMVEKKLLSHFPNQYPEELKNRPPLVSHYTSEDEARVLTYINDKHLAGEFGEQFTTQDLVVTLHELEDFYNIVKKNFPDKAPSEFTENQVSNATDDPSSTTNNNGDKPPTLPLNNAPGMSAEQTASNNLNTTGLPPNNPLVNSLGLVPNNSLVNTTTLPQNTPLLNSFGPHLNNSLVRPGMPPNNSLVRPGMPHNNSLVRPGMAPNNTLMNSGPPYNQRSNVRLPQNQPQFGQFPVYGGWLQINNTVVPYIMRGRQKVLPLQVIQNAGGLLLDNDAYNMYRGTNMSSMKKEEIEHLNISCKRAGLRFNFTADTEAVNLKALVQSCPDLVMTELPRERPLQYAKYRLTPLTPRQIDNIRATKRLPVNNTNQLQELAAKRRNLQMGGNYSASMPGMGANPQFRGPVNMPGRPRGSGRFPINRPQFNDYPMSNAKGRNPQAGGMGSDANRDVSVIHQIQRIEFLGKTVTCLKSGQNAEKFALVEAIGKLYFPRGDIRRFQHVLAEILKIPTRELTRDEEAAFISSYGLKISRLNCRRLVSLKTLLAYMPQLDYLFGEGTSNKRAMPGSGSGSTSPGRRQNRPPPPTSTHSRRHTDQRPSSSSSQNSQRSARRQKTSSDVICID